MIRKLFSINRPLVPGFIKRLDAKLMSDYPLLWTLRVHLVLWYAVLAIVLSAFYFFIKPDDPRQDSTVYFPITVMVIVSLISIVIWLIFLLRFNVFKRFGHYMAGHGMLSLGAYFICVLSIFSLPFLPPLIEDIRSSNEFNPTSTVDDVNRMNNLLAHLTYDSLQTDWFRDTVMVNDELAEKGRNIGDDKFSALEYYLDSAEIRKVVNRVYCGSRILNGDSFLLLGANRFVFLEVPNYNFIDIDQRIQALANTKILDPKKRYFQVHKEHVSVNLKEASVTYFNLLNKYRDVGYTDDLIMVDAFDENSGYYGSHENQYFMAKYRVNAVESGIDNITDRQVYFSEENIPFLMRFWLYPALFFAILVWMFRHSTTKAFFLSLLVGFILSILVGVFSALFNLSLSSLLLFQLMLWGGFLSVAFLSSNGIRNTIQGIALNLSFLTVFFIPLVVNTIYWEAQPDWPYEYQVYSQAMQDSILRAEWMGAVLLLVFLYFVSFPLYRKWYAAPEA